MLSILKNDVEINLTDSDSINNFISSLPGTIDGADVTINLAWTQAGGIQTYTNADLMIYKNIINNGSLTVRADGAQSDPFAGILTIDVNHIKVSDIVLRTAFHGISSVSAGDFANCRVTILDDAATAFSQCAIIDDDGAQGSAGAGWTFRFDGSGGTPFSSTPTTAAVVIFNAVLLSSSTPSTYVAGVFHGQNVVFQDLMFQSDVHRGVAVTGLSSCCSINRCNASGNADRGAAVFSGGVLKSEIADYPFHACDNAGQGIASFGGSVFFERSGGGRAYIAGNSGQDVLMGSFNEGLTRAYFNGCGFGATKGTVPYSVKFNENAQASVLNCLFKWDISRAGQKTIQSRNCSHILSSGNTANGAPGAQQIIVEDSDAATHGIIIN